MKLKDILHLIPSHVPYSVCDEVGFGLDDGEYTENDTVVAIGACSFKGENAHVWISVMPE